MNLNLFLGASGSYEQSPRFLTTCGRYGGQRCDSDSSISGVSMSDLSLGPKVEVELQLKENLADAMIEMPSATGSNLPGTTFALKRQNALLETLSQEILSIFKSALSKYLYREKQSAKTR